MLSRVAVAVLAAVKPNSVAKDRGLAVLGLLVFGLVLGRSVITGRRILTASPIRGQLMRVFNSGREAKVVLFPVTVD